MTNDALRDLARNLRNRADAGAVHHSQEWCYGVRFAANEVEAMIASGADFPECSGNPSDCPENEGRGCCRRNDGTDWQPASVRALIAQWRERASGGCMTGDPVIDARTETDSAAYANCADALDAIRALSPPALDAPVVGDAVKRAIHSADLYGVLMDVQNGIDSPGLPSMANNAIRLIDSAREAYASPVAAQAVTDGFVASVRWLVFAARTTGGTAGRDDGLCAALASVEEKLAALAHPNAAPCDAQGATP